MKKRGKGFIALLALSIICVFVLSELIIAADVAYVVRNENLADSGFLEFFDAMNMSVKIIENNDIMSTSFSNYKIVLIGDGVIEHLEHLSKKLHLVLTNGKYAEWFGFLKHGETPLSFLLQLAYLLSRIH